MISYKDIQHLIFLLMDLKSMVYWLVKLSYYMVTTILLLPLLDMENHPNGSEEGENIGQMPDLAR